MNCLCIEKQSYTTIMFSANYQENLRRMFMQTRSPHKPKRIISVDVECDRKAWKSDRAVLLFLLLFLLLSWKPSSFLPSFILVTSGFPGCNVTQMYFSVKLSLFFPL